MSGFRAAFVGALVVTVVSFVLSLFAGRNEERRPRGFDQREVLAERADGAGRAEGVIPTRRWL